MRIVRPSVFPAWYPGKALAGEVTPRSCFRQACWISGWPDLAERLAPAAGLRNRLVHQYDEIDDAIVLRAVADARRHFGAYLSAVEDYLQRTD